MTRKNPTILSGKKAAVGPEFVLTVGGACVLAGASSVLRERLIKELTIDNPKYLAAKKYGRWVGKKLERVLTFYELREEELVMPRGFGGRILELSQECMGRRPRIVDQRRELAPLAHEFNGSLRPYQQVAVTEVLKRHFGVLVAATGSGKTVMALAILASRRQPALILVHSKELLYQWADRISEFLKVEAGLIGDGHYEIRPVSVAIVNTARRRLTDLVRHFGQLVVDECHRVPASLFTEVVSAFDCKYSLGLSATAYRREDDLTRLIYFYMGDKAYEVDSFQLQENGAVLRPEFVQRKTDFRYVFRGNYQALLKSLTNNEARNRLIVADVIAEARVVRGTVLVVSDRVDHCRKLALMLAAQGVEAAILTGRLPAEERTAIVDSVRQGTVRVLIATLQLVGEGFDAAGLTVLFLTTPIKFSGRLLQVVGRILRPAEGKRPKVVDYLDERVGVLRNSARVRARTYQDMV